MIGNEFLHVFTRMVTVHAHYRLDRIFVCHFHLIEFVLTSCDQFFSTKFNTSMEGMIGEVRMFAGTFAPKNWAYCAGQTIQISSNTALFSILGTTYGGNGTTTFQLPDLQGRVCVGTGAGPGLTPYSLGEKSGTNAVTLSISQIPAHVHTVAGSYVPPALANQPEETNPASGYFAVSNAGDAYVSAVSSQAMGPTPMTVTVMQTGQGIPHDNQQPYLGMNYVICMYGVYPSRG